MSVLLFHLRDVGEDEADDVRQLLTTADVPFYETTAGRWNTSVPALWLADDSRFAEARALIDAYQRQRIDEQAGQAVDTWQSRVRTSPFQALIYLGAIAAVLYFFIMPFADIGG